MPSDLIYRKDAKDFVRHAYNKGMNPVEYLDEVPAADVRPAIRCNNCRYYFFGDCTHNQGMRKTDKDGFCFRFKAVSNC